ncbi:MAG: hypothetical protein LBT10_05360 [Methanobrevibacter sp.]|jgi:hypothetical protein|nr:hypothetical protein [Methanobrevibacter sp.]
MFNNEETKSLKKIVEEIEEKKNINWENDKKNLFIVCETVNPDYKKFGEELEKILKKELTKEKRIR